jgi:hypothetical protein
MMNATQTKTKTLSREDIARAIRDCGYDPCFQKYERRHVHCTRRDEIITWTTQITVLARIKGNGTSRALGRIEVVAAMSWEQIEALIKAKFAR